MTLDQLAETQRLAREWKPKGKWPPKGNPPLQKRREKRSRMHGEMGVFGGNWGKGSKCIFPVFIMVFEGFQYDRGRRVNGFPSRWSGVRLPSPAPMFSTTYSCSGRDRIGRCYLGVNFGDSAYQIGFRHGVVTAVHSLRFVSDDLHRRHGVNPRSPKVGSSTVTWILKTEALNVGFSYCGREGHFYFLHVKFYETTSVLFPTVPRFRCALFATNWVRKTLGCRIKAAE